MGVEQKILNVVKFSLFLYSSGGVDRCPADIVDRCSAEDVDRCLADGVDRRQCELPMDMKILTRKASSSKFSYSITSLESLSKISST